MASTDIMNVTVPFNQTAEARPRLLKRESRTEHIARVVDEAVRGYRALFDSDIPLREATITVKMRDDGKGVRVVLINVQGEVTATIRATVDGAAGP